MDNEKLKNVRSLIDRFRADLALLIQANTLVQPDGVLSVYKRLWNAAREAVGSDPPTPLDLHLGQRSTAVGTTYVASGQILAWLCSPPPTRS